MDVMGEGAIFGVSYARVRHDVLATSLHLAAMERHHGNEEAAAAQVTRWVTSVGPMVLEMLAIQRAMETMGEGKVH